MTLPQDALSVRQPWAWAIIHAGKPVENRSLVAIAKGGMEKAVHRRIAIHAGKGMTRDEYESAAVFMLGLGVTVPPAALLMRGGIIGSVRVTAIVTKHSSPWFFGPRALVLTQPEACEFVGAQGELGLFKWTPSGSEPEPPARWMVPRAKDAQMTLPETSRLL